MPAIANTFTSNECPLTILTLVDFAEGAAATLFDEFEFTTDS